MFDKYGSTSPCTVYNISDLVNDTICIKQGFSLSSTDSAGICYRQRLMLLAKSTARGNLLNIFTVHTSFVYECREVSVSVAETRDDPK